MNISRMKKSLRNHMAVIAFLMILSAGMLFSTAWIVMNHTASTHGEIRIADCTEGQCVSPNNGWGNTSG